MKKALLIFTILASCMVTSAQDSSPEWMNQVFSADDLSSMGQSKVDFYQLIDQFGYLVDDVSPKDISDLPDALNVTAKNADTPQLTKEILEGEFHFMLYNFSPKNNETLYYRIGDTGKILVIYSVQHTMKKIENQEHED